MIDYHIVVNFWLSPENEAFDQEIKEKFFSLYQTILEGHLKN